MYSNSHVSSLHINSGWKYYNTIKKKAMEQEFSWSGLVLSLSIAFFIVIASSLSLNMLKNSILSTGISESNNQNIYRLENMNNYSLDNYLQINNPEYSKAQNLNLPNIC